MNEVERLKIVITTLNAKYIHSSLGLRYIEKYARGRVDVDRMEFTINQEKLFILRELYEAHPDVVGFSSYIWNADDVLEIAQMLKSVLPAVKIVFGGPEVMYETADFFVRYPFVDYLVLGEGEEAFTLLAEALRDGRAVDVAGVLGRCEGGKAVIQQMADLTKIPFAYEDKDMAELADKIIYYETSRGCPFSCQYCLSGGEMGVRFLPFERVRAELDFFIRHGVRQVKFVDRTFNAKKSHFMPILHYLLEADCQTNFHFEVAADLLDDEVLDVLTKMPKGRVQLEIGVQSTHLPTLKAVHRINHWERIVHAVETIGRAGNIHLHLDLIVGLPEEGYERFGQSFNDVYALQPEMLQIGFLKLLKGCGLERSTENFGYVSMQKAPYQVLASRWLTYDEMRKLQLFEDVFEQIYNSGKMKIALAVLIGLYGKGAFTFYADLTDFWVAKGYHRVAHKTKNLYAYVYQFCVENMGEYSLVCREILRFNELLLEKGNIRAEVLEAEELRCEDEKNAFWHDDDGVRQYLPDFHFTTWRELQSRYRIEVFAIDIEACIKQGKTVERKTPILFVYGKENRYIMIQEKDFWKEEEHGIS